jgi:hypothetical protein
VGNFGQRSGAGRELEILVSVELGVLALVNLEAIHNCSVIFFAQNYVSIAETSSRALKKYAYHYLQNIKETNRGSEKQKNHF